MLKYAMEILLSESSVITSHYFKWNTSAVAIFLAILGLTVLPINAVVGTYISNMFEDRFVNLMFLKPCYFLCYHKPIRTKVLFASCANKVADIDFLTKLIYVSTGNS
jgi:hypothetical protein